MEKLVDWLSDVLPYRRIDVICSHVTFWLAALCFVSLLLG